VGHSGAGKTTLVGLLLHFYSTSKGEFKIGGVPVEDLTPAQMRELMAFVPQDTNLFNRTVAENIAYARPDAEMKDIVRAATEAQALDFIEKLPDGFDTVIGERGVKLSGGQRQRIAIARALLKNAPILILDEATSALDSVSEQAIQKAFVAAMKDRTAIVVAHRLSTLRHLDRIVVFEGGTIVEQGTHDELVAAEGLYADLWRRQKDGFIGE
jgi:ATP-binding cassette, subfamily B, bacterial